MSAISWSSTVSLFLSLSLFSPPFAVAFLSTTTTPAAANASGSAFSRQFAACALASLDRSFGETDGASEERQRAEFASESPLRLHTGTA